MKNIIGNKYGKVIVKKEIDRNLVYNPSNKRVFLCVCDCDKEIKLTYKQLVRHNTKISCHVCRKLPEKSKNTTTYTTYRSMRDRCLNKNHNSYPYYGGRGIKICERWLGRIVGFKNFLEDMGERPHGMTLDRINVNGNYEPSNCRWSTQKTQINNRRK
jgi:hypothetical protein